MPKTPKTKSSSRSVSAMRLRVYPTLSQVSRSARWLSLAHKFRNETVAFLNARRLARTAWIRKHPALSKGWIPEEFAGNDANAASLWLTGRLESARLRVRLESGLIAGKLSISPALAHLSRGEIDAIEDAWLLRAPRTIFDQVLQDIKKTLTKAISDRSKKKLSKVKIKKNKKKKNKKPAGFPGFRKYRYAASVRLQVTASRHADFKSHWEAGELYVPGLGKLKFRDKQSLPKTPPSLMTIARDASGAWYVSFVCVEGEGLGALRPALASLVLPLDSLGNPTVNALDLSLASIGVDTEGNKLGRIRHLKAQQSKLRFLSKSLSRKTKGSRRWQKAKKKVGKLNVEVANLRELFLTAHAKAFVSKSAIVCLEDFALAFMLVNRHLSSSSHDAGFGMFRQRIEAEAAKLGHLVIKCGRFDASSKTCSCCGTIKQDLKLKDRNWTCSSCGHNHDRDQNAAVNIRIMAILKAIADLSMAPEMGVGAISSHPLHTDLESFIARGGLTALLEFYSSESRKGGSDAVFGLDKARETRILPNQPTQARRERACVG